MAVSKCPKGDCNGTSFEMKELKNVRDSKFRHMAVQCSICGAVVAVKDFLNLGYAIEKIAQGLKIQI